MTQTVVLLPLRRNSIASYARGVQHQTQNTAVDFFNVKIERYPNHLARTVLWGSASALYAVRARPSEDVGEILVAGWL